MRDQGRMRDRGSLSLFFLGIALGFLALTGLVLDGGGKVLTEERADAVAREAARAACEQIDVNAVLGGTYQIDRTRAAEASAEYLGLAGMNGSPPQFPAGACSVAVTTTYRTKLLGLIGIDQITVTGHGTAVAFYGITGPEGSVGN
ncbi:pilus assembly protein TadG-related protein [Streptacidiphilus sp. MAP5-3]|uniref:pilus assembly protein TadG-related protein n=1 Tax=unclassified Streptacidiphilus TaxID=2643834 RepID=UPI003510DA02